MTQSHTVLLVGLRTDVVDFAKWPDLTPERIRAGLAAAKEDLEQQGFPTELCLVDRGETAQDVLVDALTEQQPDCVLVGAGVRMDANLTPLLELVVNAVREHAPHARIAFNTSPFDSAAAVRRLL